MNRTIGFIGLGAMGGPMAKNLLKKGHCLVVFDLVAERMEGVVKEGAQAASSCQEVAAKADVVITMLPASAHVREAILGAQGVHEGIRPGSVVIDMSTIDPMTSQEVGQVLAEKGVKMLDAPVARGVPAAVGGTLVIFVGGDRATFDQCREILAGMGTDIHYIGGLGAGEVVKIINNLIVSTEMALLAEALVLGVKAGVKADVLFEALSTGSANSFVLQNHVRNAVMKGRFEKNVFPVDYIIKDLGLALAMGAKYHVPLRMGSLAVQAYETARAAGYSDRYIPVVIRPLEELTGVEVRGET